MNLSLLNFNGSMQSVRLIAGMVVFTLFSGFSLYAQNPTIEGNLILCPFGSSVLTPQEYDAYQWYKREYFGDEVILLEGETNQTLEVSSPDFSVVYVSVKVWVGDEEYTSPEVLVDELVFSPVFVQTSGDFTVGPAGEAILQEGDVLYFTVFGISSNIEWYRNEALIPGENGITLEVTQSGIYQARGGFGQCPDYPLQWTLPLEVIVVGGVNVEDVTKSDQGLNVWPNPANEMIQISSERGTINQISLYDPAGRLVLSSTQMRGDLSLSSIPAGIYFLRVGFEEGTTESIRIQKL